MCVYVFDLPQNSVGTVFLFDNVSFYCEANWPEIISSWRIIFKFIKRWKNDKVMSDLVFGIFAQFDWI